MKIEIKGPTDWYRVLTMNDGSYYVECGHAGYGSDEDTVTAMELMKYLPLMDSSQIRHWVFMSGWGVRVIKAGSLDQDGWIEAERWEVFATEEQAKTWIYSELDTCPLCFTPMDKDTSECHVCMMDLTESELDAALEKYLTDAHPAQYLGNRAVKEMLRQTFHDRMLVVGYLQKASKVMGTQSILDDVLGSL